MGVAIAVQKDTSTTELQRIFDLQHKNQYKVANATARERRAKLDKFHKAVMKYREEIKTALHKDYRKHPSEVDLTEIYPVTSECKDAKQTN